MFKRLMMIVALTAGMAGVGTGVAVANSGVGAVRTCFPSITRNPPSGFPAERTATASFPAACTGTYAFSAWESNSPITPSHPGYLIERVFAAPWTVYLPPCYFQLDVRLFNVAGKHVGPVLAGVAGGHGGPGCTCP